MIENICINQSLKSSLIKDIIKEKQPQNLKFLIRIFQETLRIKSKIKLLLLEVDFKLNHNKNRKMDCIDRNNTVLKQKNLNKKLNNRTILNSFKTK